MKASVETLNTVQRRVKVEVTAESVNKAFDNAYRTIQRKAQIQGFRPGKAPLNLIRKLYGNKAAFEVLDNLVRENLFAALEESKLRAVAQPVLDQVEELPVADKEYSFSAVVDVMPELDIKGYQGLAIEAPTDQIDTKEIETELENLRRHHAKTKSVEDGTAAAKGHMVTLSHKVSHNGADVPSFDTKGIKTELGRGELFSDLEKAVYGMKARESKTVPVTLPADYPDQELAGQTMQFALTLDEVQDLVVPNLDDDFAKDLGVEGLDKLKEIVEKNLRTQATNDRRQALESSALSQILDKNPFDVPPAMVDQVIDSMIDNLRWPDEKEKGKAKQDEEFRKRFRENAKRQARNTLVLWEIARKEGLQVSDDDLNEHIRKMFGSGADTLDDSRMTQIRTALGERARERLLFDKALDHVIGQASVKETARSAGQR